MSALTENLVTDQQVRQQLFETFKRVAEGDTVVVTRDGEPNVVLMSFEQYEEMRSIEADYHIMMADAAQARADRGEALSGEDFIASLRQLRKEHFGDEGRHPSETTDFSEFVDMEYLDEAAN